MTTKKKAPKKKAPKKPFERRYPIQTVARDVDAPVSWRDAVPVVAELVDDDDDITEMTTEEIAEEVAAPRAVDSTDGGAQHRSWPWSGGRK